MVCVVDRPRYKLAKNEAEKIIEKYTSPPIPVLEVAENNGVDVVFTGFGVHKDKVAGFCDFKNAKLYINNEDPINRKTFTMAHELGHWILHRELFLSDPDSYKILPRFQKIDSHNNLEVEANTFAANLLVPKELLLPVKDAPSAVLAGIFNVSRAMMEIRLKNV